MSEETLQQTFTVPTPARLKLGNICGSVSVQPGEDGAISVVAIKHTHTGDARHTEIEMRQADDGSVTVETRFDEGFWRWLGFGRPCNVDYTVRVPRACSLKVSCVSSSANIRGLEGDFDVSLVSGDVTLDELSGALGVSTVSGEVEGRHIAGRLKLNAVSGHVLLSEADLTSVEATTVSGNLTLSTALSPEGTYRFQSTSGDVRLVVPPGTRCTVRASSVSGRVHTSLPVTASRSANGRRVLDVRGGGASVALNSVSGDLWLGVPSGAAETAEPAAPAEPASPSRAGILDHIERGEMTVEEGLELLKQR